MGFEIGKYYVSKEYYTFHKPLKCVSTYEVEGRGQKGFFNTDPDGWWWIPEKFREVDSFERILRRFINL